MSIAEAEATVAEAKELTESMVRKFVDFRKPVRTQDEKEDSFIGKKYVPLVKNGVNSIVSTGGVGKTSTAIKIGIHSVSDEDLKVYAHLSEDQEGDINDMVHHSTEITQKLIENLHIESVTAEPHRILTSNGEITKKWQENMEYLAQYDLLILDPLVSFIDEMDNETADRVFSVLNRYCKEHSVTILLLHHTSKGTGSSRGVTTLTNKPRLVYELRKITEEVTEDRKKVQRVDVKRLHLRELSVFKANSGYFSEMLDNNGFMVSHNEIGLPVFTVQVFKKDK